MGEDVTYKLTNNRLVPGRMRLPGWAQVFMEAEQMYQGMTGRSPLRTPSKEQRLHAHTEQVGKNKFLPSGLALNAYKGPLMRPPIDIHEQRIRGLTGRF